LSGQGRRGTGGGGGGGDDRAAVRAGRWTVEIARPDKVLFPDDGITKLDLAEYYAGVAPAMLPHVRGRPVAMERYPDGLNGQRFYQKNVNGSVPHWVHTAPVGKQRGFLTQIVCDNAATLVYLADQACITPHVWLSRVDRPDHPDQMIFDLDPLEGQFAQARRAALTLKGLLEDLGLPAFPKTTGGKGIHVMVPVDRRADFDSVREFARGVGELLAAREPKRYTMEQRKGRRGGRLFIDIMRNAYAQHAVAPYAVRARAGAPVATPLDWSEVEDEGMRPERFTLRTIPERVQGGRDPWGKPRGRSLTLPRRRLAEMLAGEVT
jgi:bifunctional non-homologous end joining protein LigD